MNMDKPSKAKVTVSGRVQGVFYRQSTKDKAQSLGLSGWVKNEHNGNVLIEAAGARAGIEALIQWCQQGPPSARVDKVQVEWSDIDDGEPQIGFRIVG
jgi:acylphosphatase